jgi:alpha-L-arabinofuranosidase
MIWFDNISCVRTTSYYVQQLYALNKGTHTLSLTMNKKNVTGAEGQNGLFASAVRDKDKQEYIVKVANTSGQKQPVSLRFEGLGKKDQLTSGKCIKPNTSDPNAENTIENPHRIVPEESVVTINRNLQYGIGSSYVCNI